LIIDFSLEEKKLLFKALELGSIHTSDETLSVQMYALKDKLGASIFVEG